MQKQRKTEYEWIEERKLDEATVQFEDGRMFLGGRMSSYDRSRLMNEQVHKLVLAFCRHGDITAAATNFDTNIQLRENSTPKCVLSGHSAPIDTLCFNHDGSLLVSGSRDDTIRIWDTQTGQCVHVLTGHTGPIYSVGFDSGSIVSGSLDGTVRFWAKRLVRDCPVHLAKALQPFIPNVLLTHVVSPYLNRLTHISVRLHASLLYNKHCNELAVRFLGENKNCKHVLPGAYAINSSESQPKIRRFVKMDDNSVLLEQPDCRPEVFINIMKDLPHIKDYYLLILEDCFGKHVAEKIQHTCKVTEIVSEERSEENTAAKRSRR